MSDQLKVLYRQDRRKRILKMIDIPAIQFIPKETQHDMEGSTNKLTSSLHLGDSSLGLLRIQIYDIYI